MKKIFFFSIVFMLLFTTAAFASEKISPAIDIIANESTMVKSGILNDGEISFDVDDFDNPLGINVSSIKITSLPSDNCGKLMLDNLYVVENQVVYREDFSMLRFVSTQSKPTEATFKFKPNGFDYEIECSLIPLSVTNLSPVASNGAEVSAWTMKNIACFGTLLGYDPEDDELEFEIVSYPKKALLCLTNKQTGDYIYTPYKNAKGKDSFSYRVRDSYGNYSEECVVEFKINRKDTTMAFNDVLETDLIAVSTVCEKSLMDYVKNIDGSYSFNPNEEITREEFVTLIMRAMGAKEAPEIDKTRFADDSEIASEYKGYIESAFSLGIISGTVKDDGVHFDPKEPITLAEAAVIINKILGTKVTTSLTVFSDDSEIPSWARGAIESLTEAGILKKSEGKISPNSPLTKAQTAQIILALLKYRNQIK